MLVRSVQSNDQILLAIVGAKDFYVGIGETGIAKSLCHRFGRRANVSDRVRGLDFDQFLKDIVCQFPGRIIDLRLRSWCKRYEKKEPREENCGFASVQMAVSGNQSSNFV